MVSRKSFSGMPLRYILSTTSSSMSLQFRTMLKTDSMLHSVQVPNQLGGERFPDPLEADTTVTGGVEKALPKDKAQ